MPFILNHSVISHTPRAARKPNGGWVVQCPAHDDKDPSLSLDEIDGKAVWFCHAGCDQAEIRDGLSQRGMIYVETLPPNPAPIIRKQSSTNWMRTIWEEATHIHRTPAYRRLEERGLAYDGKALRWHSTKNEMLAKIISPDGERATALHRTDISSGKRKLNGHMGGGAIRLYPQKEERVLIIAEGVETALAWRTLNPQRPYPIWATVSTTGMASFIPPTDLDCLIVAADCDGPGLTAAEKLRKRLDIDVDIHCPPKHGQDWNDVLRTSSS